MSVDISMIKFCNKYNLLSLNLSEYFGFFFRTVKSFDYLTDAIIKFLNDYNYYFFTVIRQIVILFLSLITLKVTHLLMNVISVLQDPHRYQV